MKTFQAILTGNQRVNIGEFPDSNAAYVWALQEYGGNLSAVDEVQPSNYTITVDKWALDPAWYLVALVAGVLLLAANDKRKEKRGRNVSKRK